MLIEAFVTRIKIAKHKIKYVLSLNLLIISRSMQSWYDSHSFIIWCNHL